ncbi:MAG: pilus assembly protein PilM [Ignavibacteriae bacterium]|nr:pilus assembly protein PilM [Ignavibacteriota bacterium]
MPVKRFILGLSLSSKTVQAVEIEQDGISNTLLSLGEWENTLFTGPKENGDGADRFMEHLSHFISTYRVRAKHVGVTLDTSFLFLNTLPLDAGLSRKEIRDHVQWELSMYFPEYAPADFVTDVHVLSQEKTEPWNETLTVAVRRHDTIALHKTIENLGLALQILDVDHFSADTALRSNYPDKSKKYIALIGVKENRLDVSLIRCGNLEDYSYFTIRDDQEIVDQIGTLSRETRGLHSITAYGSHLNNQLLSRIRSESSLLVEALNPLRHVRVADSLRIANNLSTPFYHFTSAVGVALRRD